MFLFDETIVAIAKGVGTHAVEKAAAAIKEVGGIAVTLQDARDSLDIVREIAFDDGVAGQGRKRGQDAFHAADSAVSASVEIGEKHSVFGSEFVHFRSEGIGASETAPEFGAEAFFEENNDVETRAGGIAGDAAAERVARFDKLSIGFGQEPARPLVGVVQGKGFVKCGVIEVVGPGGCEEGEGAVVGDLVEGAIVTDAGSFEVKGGEEQKSEDDNGGQMEEAGFCGERTFEHGSKEFSGS